ncbi:MAG: SMI1/KNR4 family protein [Pseudobacter sp.]|uniref:SMI1/KNR4 family protein n=1 Tax=Pseudobacter sp. TaxID=2045420 RepID=UPI003F7F17D1
MNDIQALETTIGAVIPESLKAIIIKPPVITPGSDRFMRNVDSDFKQELSLHRFMTIAEMQAAWNNLKGDSYFRDQQLLVFAETLGSPMICIGTGANNHGEIYVFDYDFDATRIAGSVDEFLGMLY